jgi:hypothetical protein
LLAQPPPVNVAERRPGVVVFYRIWCAVFVALYLGFCVMEILVARGMIEPGFGLLEDFASRDNAHLRERLIAEKRAEAPALAAFLFGIALIYAAAAAIPRKPGAWIFAIVVLATTIFPFVITAAGTAPILMHWARPAVKRYFGRPA